jgi:subtilisin family serine protease
VLTENSTVQIRDFHIADVSKNFIEGEKILFRYDIGTFIAYSAVFTKSSLSAVLENPNVQYVEADQVVTLSDITIDEASEEDTSVVQKNPTWGIDRIDQENLPLDNLYQYYGSAGEDVTAYVVDTGILLTHVDFEKRASFGFSSITNEANTDLNGHGTHVAGTIGGATWGVAKKVTLVAVKVLSGGGSGTWAGVVAGVDFVAKDHVNRGKGALSVANMSLGGGATSSLDKAVEQAVAQGVNFAVAGGNSADNACNYSPARVASAVCVGATDNTDTRSYFSNFGVCTDVFAPGTAITSAWIGSSNTATNTISGTSMASPHVAGVIAVRLGHLNLVNPGGIPPIPNDIEVWIKMTGTQGVLKDVGVGSPNTLIFSPFSGIEQE